MTGKTLRFAAVSLVVLTTGALLGRPSGQAGSTGRAIGGRLGLLRRRRPELALQAVRSDQRRRTSAASRSRGASAPTTWARISTSGSAPRPSWPTASSTSSAAACADRWPRIDASTGTLLWVHTEDEGLRAEFAPRVGAGRGVSYWTDGKEERIIYVTTGYRMKALNAKTGALMSDVRRERRRRSEEGLRSGSQPLRAARRDALTMADIGLHASRPSAKTRSSSAPRAARARRRTGRTK